MSQLCLLDASTSTPVLKLSADEALDGIIIGRNDIPNPHPEAKAFISRKHLSVSWDPNLELLLLTDNGSPNGTYVNGIRVRTATLKVGDVIQAGGAQSYEFGRYYRKWPPWSWKILVADLTAETLAKEKEVSDAAAASSAMEPLSSQSLSSQTSTIIAFSAVQSPDCIATLRSPLQQLDDDDDDDDDDDSRHGGGEGLSVSAESHTTPCPKQDEEVGGEGLSVSAESHTTPCTKQDEEVAAAVTENPPGMVVEDSPHALGEGASAPLATFAMATDNGGDGEEDSGEGGGEGGGGGGGGGSSIEDDVDDTSSIGTDIEEVNEEEEDAALMTDDDACFHHSSDAEACARPAASTLPTTAHGADVQQLAEVVQGTSVANQEAAERQERSETVPVVLPILATASTQAEEATVATAAGDKRTSSSSSFTNPPATKKVKSEFAVCTATTAVSTGAAAAAAAEDTVVVDNSGDSDGDVVVLQGGAEEPTTGNKDFRDEEEEEEEEEEEGEEEKEEGEEEEKAEEEDKGVELISSTGGMLCDFPHSREHCTLRPFAASGGNNSNALACPNCFCYVCDAPVASCPQWSSSAVAPPQGAAVSPGSGGGGDRQLHCNATCKDIEWRNARAAQKKEAQLKAAREAAKAAVTTTTTLYTANPAAAANSAAVNGPAVAAGATGYSLQELMRQVEQVYPEEEPEPAGLAAHVTLRPYQRQSLAFALNAERQPQGADPALVCPPGAYASPLTANSTNSAACSKRSGAGLGGEVQKQQPCFGGWIADEMGMGKTAVVIALVLANPAAAGAARRASDEAWHAFEATGRHSARPKEWVKATPPGHVSRGLTEAQVLALYDRKRVGGKWCRKNHAYARWTPPAPLPRTQAFFGGPLGPYHLNLKATLVLTSVSLLGQWEDEFRRYAPGLVVCKHFGAKRWSREELGDWRDADVILSSMSQSFEAPHELFQRATFHRIVLDESHGMNNHPSFLQLRSKHRWACTGTPVTMSIRQLEKQARFLGQLHRLQPLLNAYSSAFEGSATTNSSSRPLSAASAASAARAAAAAEAFSAVVAALRQCCIRHTKAMRLGGSVALALPDETCETVLLTMSAQDRKAYDAVLKQPPKTVLARLLAQGGKSFSLEMGLSLRRHICARSATKLNALRRDLLQQRDSDQAVHAVVFTSFKDVHQDVVDTLKRDGFDVFQFSGGTHAKERHASIRVFQESSSSSSSSSTTATSSSAASSSSSSSAKPSTKVFVITLRAGAVGITLTAASTVYLMEPSIDPAVEVQAAGRIHRLGQTKEVLIKRFVFKNTIEEAVCEVHSKIKAGEVAITDSLFPASMVQLLCSK